MADPDTSNSSENNDDQTNANQVVVSNRTNNSTDQVANSDENESLLPRPNDIVVPNDIVFPNDIVVPNGIGVPNDIVVSNGIVVPKPKKDIFVMIIWACLLIIICIIGLVKMINSCQTEPTTDMRTSPKEIHFDLLLNVTAVICEKKTEDHFCRNVPVYDTKLGKNAKLIMTKYPEEITETFYPRDSITLQNGTYSVQFEMSIFHHVTTDGSFHYEVTLKLDEEPLDLCVHGLLGHLPSSEIDNCLSIETPDQKYTIDPDDSFTYVRSRISFKIDLSVEKPESNLTLMFGKEGFVNKGTLIVTKLH